MQPKHYTTRLFIGLFIITMLTTYLALALTTRYNETVLENAISDLLTTPRQKASAAPQAPKLLPTEGWQSYIDKAYPISFSYPAGWQVQTAPITKEGFYDITVKPTDKTPNFHISISRDSFLGLDGLVQEPYVLGNLKGTSVNDTLVAIKTGEYYYTFDASLNSKKILEFQTLMSTVRFQ